jgi:hypothetical protein
MKPLLAYTFTLTLRREDGIRAGLGQDASEVCGLDPAGLNVGFCKIMEIFVYPLNSYEMCNILYVVVDDLGADGGRKKLLA